MTLLIRPDRCSSYGVHDAVTRLNGAWNVIDKQFNEDFSEMTAPGFIVPENPSMNDNLKFETFSNRIGRAQLNFENSKSHSDAGWNKFNLRKEDLRKQIHLAIEEVIGYDHVKATLSLSEYMRARSKEIGEKYQSLKIDLADQHFYGSLEIICWISKADIPIGMKISA